MVPGNTTELRIVTVAERDGVLAAEHGSFSDPGP
jgi:hypothetical protein